MSIMDRISGRFSQNKVKIEVPEWGDDNGPLIIYSDYYTIKDDQAVKRFMKDDDPHGFVEIVVRKAMDSDGNKLFNLDDKPKLARKGESHVLKRIALSMMASISIEEAEGN